MSEGIFASIAFLAEWANSKAGHLWDCQSYFLSAEVLAPTPIVLTSNKTPKTVTAMGPPTRAIVNPPKAPPRVENALSRD